MIAFLTHPHRIATRLFPVDHYDLEATLNSGQAFRWNLVDAGWESVLGHRWVRLVQESQGISASVLRQGELSWQWLEEYLQLNVDFGAILRTFPTDEHLTKAVASCPGLRLLRQEPWECLASFILSSTKQIVQIRQIVHLICERFGDNLPAPGARRVYSFPAPQRIAALSETDLRCCKMGFRAPYLKGTAEMIVRGEVSLENIARMPVEHARAELMRLPGVGRKIADCVLLFAYGFQQAFPVDVWVLKALRQLYFPKRRPNPRKIMAFTETYFGPNAGYAQQYLFHYMRTRLGRNTPA